MKKLDEMSEEYSGRLCNQSGTYTKGEIEMAYVTGAIETKCLPEDGTPGTGSQALASLQAGHCVTRLCWDERCFIIKQIDSDISAKIVPVMQSLPASAKKRISGYSDGTIHYRDQCLMIRAYPNGEHKGYHATNYVPNWVDLFATDWVVVD